MRVQGRCRLTWGSAASVPGGVAVFTKARCLLVPFFHEVLWRDGRRLRYSGVMRGLMRMFT